MNADQKGFLLAFLKKHTLAVVATTDVEGNPEAALVAFGHNEAFELVFGTSNTTRKYHNLQVNQRVAVVIGWEQGHTLQYEGTARELTGEEDKKYRELLYTKSPASREHADAPDERHFAVSPRWLRYSDINQEPPQIIELTF